MIIYPNGIILNNKFHQLWILFNSCSLGKTYSVFVASGPTASFLEDLLNFLSGVAPGAGVTTCLLTGLLRGMGAGVTICSLAGLLLSLIHI